ncbi:hypothetical protein ATSB10_22410 [Dyella thiooxydans]|uniref:Uncharacterized protein n=1 Tax=Dyella thiooxydans TaxID=445710 RepID=A0A161J2Q2_9GAMM|nr:hypothetical protein ATSB10_22410 [Dyella thiooxydans]
MHSAAVASGRRARGAGTGHRKTARYGRAFSQARGRMERAGRRASTLRAARQGVYTRAQMPRNPAAECTRPCPAPP